MTIHLTWGSVDLHGLTIDTSLTSAETEELQRLSKGKQVLEIGSAYGYSSIAMALGGAKHVLCVDPHGGPVSLPYSWERMASNVAHFGLQDKISRLRLSSQEVLPALHAADLRFDFIFVDGDHAQDVATHDYFGSIKLAPIVALHDYGEITCPGVQGALDSVHPEPPTRLIDSLWVLEQ